MDRINYWMQHITGLVYVAFQSIILFYAVNFIATRMYFDFVTESAVFWLIGSGWLYFLPLAYFSKLSRNRWLLFALVISCAIGIIIIGYSFFLVLLSGLLVWLIGRRRNKPIDKSDFIQLFLANMFWFCLALILTFPFNYTNQEINLLIRYFSISILFTLIGIMLSHLVYIQHNKNRLNFFKIWGYFNGIMCGGLVILAIGSILPSIGVGLLFSVFRVLLVWILSPFSWLVKSVPALREEISKAFRDADESGDGTEFRGVTQRAYEKIQHFLIQIDFTFMKYLFLILLIILILYFLYYLLKKDKDQGEMDKPIIINKSVSSQSLNEIKESKDSSWRQKAKDFFKRYSGKEEDPIRKEYRQLLKIMRQVGVWKSDTMTLEEINRVFAQIKTSSSLYQKVRYGDQRLNKDEVQMFKNEVQEVIGSLRQIKKELD